MPTIVTGHRLGDVYNPGAFARRSYYDASLEQLQQAFAGKCR